MNDAQTSSTARALALHRWGSQRLERMAAELVERRDELDPTQRDRLARALVDDTWGNNDGGDRRRPHDRLP